MRRARTAAAAPGGALSLPTPGAGRSRGGRRPPPRLRPRRSSGPSRSHLAGPPPPRPGTAVEGARRHSYIRAERHRLEAESGRDLQDGTDTKRPRFGRRDYVRLRGTVHSRLTKHAALQARSHNRDYRAWETPAQRHRSTFRRTLSSRLTSELRTPAGRLGGSRPTPRRPAPKSPSVPRVRSAVSSNAIDSARSASCLISPTARVKSG